MKIGIDINHNAICGVLICENVVLATITTPFNDQSSEHEKEVMEGIIMIINNLLTPKVKKIGISLPTKIDSDKGIVYDLKKIPHWKYFRVKTIIEEKFHIPTFINSDLNCFLLGEKHHGSCKAFKNIACLTLDSCIGSSVIANNYLYSKKQPAGNYIDCLSKIDCNHIEKRQDDYIRTLNGLQFLATTFVKETKIPDHKIWENIGITSGRLISILLDNFAPQVIVLGGELATSYDYCAQAITAYLKTFARSDVSIIPAETKNAKAIGAAYL